MWTTMLAPLLLGCPQGFVSDAEGLRINDPLLAADPLNGLVAESPYLEGTRFCPQITCEGDCPAQDNDVVADCFAQTIDGAQRDEDGCLLLDSPGEVGWAFEPMICRQNEAGYAPERDWVHLVVVPASEVSAEILQFPEELAEQHLVPQTVFPTDWKTEEGVPFRVVAGERAVFAFGLRHPEHAEVVAFEPWDLEVSSDGGVEAESPWLFVRLGAGERTTVRVSGAGQSWEIGTFVGVAAEDLVSMEVVAGHLATTDALRVPFGARAVLRDGSGNVVYGAPVDWSIRRGRLAVKRDDRLPGLDYAVLDDHCVAPSRNVGERHATLRAEYLDFREEIDLDWTASTTPGSDESWEAAPECLSGGCGCSSGGATVPAGFAGALLAAMGLRRRRSC